MFIIIDSRINDQRYKLSYITCSNERVTIKSMNYMIYDGIVFAIRICNHVIKAPLKHYKTNYNVIILIWLTLEKEVINFINWQANNGQTVQRSQETLLSKMTKSLIFSQSFYHFPYIWKEIWPSITKVNPNYNAWVRWALTSQRKLAPSRFLPLFQNRRNR